MFYFRQSHFQRVVLMSGNRSVNKQNFKNTSFPFGKPQTKSSSLNGRASKRGWGGGRAIKEKITFSLILELEEKKIRRT